MKMLLELMVYHRGVQGLACSCLKGICLHLIISIVVKDLNVRFGYVSNFPVYAAYSEIAWQQWNVLAYRVEAANAFNFEKEHSQPSRSSKPKSSM